MVFVTNVGIPVRLNAILVEVDFDDGDRLKFKKFLGRHQEKVARGIGVTTPGGKRRLADMKPDRTINLASAPGTLGWFTLITRAIYCSVALFLILLLVWSKQVYKAQGSWQTSHFTNDTMVANSRTILLAMYSGHRGKTEELIGSQVAFHGQGSSGKGASLVLSSNIWLDVKLFPPKDVEPIAAAWTAEVWGTLTSVDFDKRIIHIQARPENWIHLVAY